MKIEVDLSAVPSLKEDRYIRSLDTSVLRNEVSLLKSLLAKARRDPNTHRCTPTVIEEKEYPFSPSPEVLPCAKCGSTDFYRPGLGHRDSDDYRLHCFNCDTIEPNDTYIHPI